MDELRRLNATSDSLDEPLAYPLGRTATRLPRPTASPHAPSTDLVISVIPIVRNRARSRLGWFIPLHGIATTVIALLIATAFTNVTVGGPPL
jgi:hypothetical protein